MTIDRRKFIKSSLAGAAAVGLGNSLAASSRETPVGAPPAFPVKAGLNISFQEGIAPGANLKEKFDFMEEHGVVGFEPHGRGLKGRMQEFKDALKGRNIKVSAVCAGFEGFILSTDPAIRKKCRDTMEELIILGGELGSTGVIIVPAFNSQVPVMPHTQETRDFLCEQFNEMGNTARKYGTTVILEPLNRKEAFYAAFVAAGKHLQHVHMASRKRRSMPGEDGEADNYMNGFRGLKMIGYDKYVSFECGCQGDRKVVVPAALELLRKQWKEA